MSDSMVIAWLALAVPARSYQIEAVLRQKPELEAPAEACLRALSIVGRLSDSTLAGYLGLSVPEFEIIAADLHSRFLVRRSGPDLILTDQGKKSIDPAAPGQKREKVSVKLSFEETAFAEAPRARAKAWMKRMNPTEVREDGRPEAANAFREGFWAWRARERRWAGREKTDSPDDALSRIVSVSPLGRETCLIKAPVVLAAASNAAFIDVAEIDLGTITSQARREECAEAFQKTVRETSAARDGGAALDWISTNIIAIPGAPLLDPVSWSRRVRLSEVSVSEGFCLVSESIPSFIARGEFNKWLEEELVGRDDLNESSTDPIVVWSPPESETWRLDADIDAACSRLQSELRDEQAESLLAAIFRIRRGSERDMTALWKIHNRGEPFGAALLYSTARHAADDLSAGIGEELPQSLELIVRPGRWAIATAHLVSGRSPIPIPVGVATSDPVAVDKVVAALRRKIVNAEDQDWLSQGGRSGSSRAAAYAKRGIQNSS